METDDAQRATLRRAWIVLGVVGLSNFQIAMTLSMIFVVFPELEGAFPDSSPATLSWVVNVFTIVGAATVVLGGAVSQRRGAKQTMVAGTVVFTVSSLGAAIAPSVGVLMACRVGQALGASLSAPAGATIIFSQFPLARRATALACWAAIGAVGAALGPSLGGVLIDLGSWRWAFWMNLPVGAVAIAAAVVLIPSTQASAANRMPDGLSAGALLVGLGSLVLGLVQSPEWGWADPRTLVSLFGGAAVLGGVIRRSLRHPRPLLRLDLFHERTFAVGNSALLVYSTSFFGFLLASVVFLTEVWDLSIRRAGLLTTPIFAVTAITSVVSGRLGQRIGFHRTIGIGGLVWALGPVAMAVTLDASPSTSRWLAAVVVTGLGSGLLWGGLTAWALAGVAPDEMSAGAGLNQTLQGLGNTLGVAIVVTVLGEVAFGDVGRFPVVWLASAVLTLAATAIVWSDRSRIVAPVGVRGPGERAAGAIGRRDGPRHVGGLPGDLVHHRAGQGQPAGFDVEKLR